MRIAVAMSGGVDSAVAAARLVEQGHEVVGVTIRLVDLASYGLGSSRCCSPGDVLLAGQVCWQLGIPHRVIDLGESFAKWVLKPFVESYLQGHTPSPCPRCNSRVKFGELLRLLPELEAEFVATGHYARVTNAGGDSALLRGVDRQKDQSYFLFELKPEQLTRVVFPLGELCKTEVRAQAARLGLASAGERDSQEMCFVPPGGSYLDVIQALKGANLDSPGEIVDTDGHVVGQHKGVHRFTIGQRRGLGIASTKPLYVVKLDVEGQRVVVGPRDAALRNVIEVEGVNWHIANVQGELRALVQVRSRNEPAQANVRKLSETEVIVEFDEPVMAPAPGQAAVMYQGDRVIAGGWIMKSR